MRPVLAPPSSGPVDPLPAPPTFSVIVAAYQVADVIGDALGSAFAQTRPAQEVIVCDDGSTDDVAAALKPYAGRIRLIRQENRGESSAKNRAARVATGDFVVILDADDVFHPQRLEALGELAAARPDLDIVTTDAEIEVDGRFVRRCYTSELPFPVVGQRAAILERNFVFGLAAVQRRRWLEVGGFDETIRWAADWDFWARLILDGSRVGLVDEPLAHYRLRSGSLSSQRHLLFEGRVRTLEKAHNHPSLTPREREITMASLAVERRRLALARARAALAGDLRYPRRRSLAVALGRGQPLRTRAKAAAAAFAPGLAAKLLLGRDRETTGGILVPPPGAASGRRS